MKCRSADCISCWRSSCIWIRLPPQVGMSSAHREYLRREHLMENLERQSTFRNSSACTSYTLYCSSFFCYHRGHLHENRIVVCKHSSALAACCLFGDLMPVQSQASGCMGNEWVRDRKKRSGVMVEFVFCCQIVQITSIEGTRQRETRKQSIRFESFIFWGCLHTGMITHYMQKSLLVPKLVSRGGQNQPNRKG